MFSYEGLSAQLKKKGITKSDLTTEIGISSRTVAKIAKGEKLSRLTLEKIAAYAGKSATIRSCSFCAMKKKRRSPAGFTMNCRFG